MTSPFRVEVAQRDLDDLRRRLDGVRWADEIGNDDWRYGVNGAYLRELAGYWRDGFDWREQERRMNAVEHRRVVIDGQPVHFLHARSGRADAVPIVLTHGWPWTFWDFHEVIEPLTSGEPAFDVVVASLPGFAFSTPLDRVVTPWRTAGLWDVLMRDVLGHDRYAAAGGDWGAVVSAELAGPRFAPLIGVYLSSAPMGRTGGMAARTPEDYGPDEAGWYERSSRKWAQTTTSHVSVQAADPQTLAWALDDSPVGLAAWLLERRRNWCDGELEQVWTREFLLTTVSLYWFTHTIATSMRIYADTYPAGLRGSPTPAAGRPVAPRRYDPIVDPLGMGVFLGDVALLPRRIVEQIADLRYWSVHETGGHFSPSEQPEAWIDDLRDFFGQHLG